MKHSSIVGFLRYFSDSTFLYLLLELCNNHCMMTLWKNRGRISEPELRYYMKQIVGGIDHLHRNKIIHRDLKLGNIFLHNMTVKIGDFGLACKLTDDNERKLTVCGTPNYIAPEILQGHKKAKGTGHSYEVDIWSTGVIMYTLLCGAAPFTAKDTDATYKRIINNIYEFPRDILISKEAKDLIRWMLSPNPLDRPKPAQILSHPWFSGYTPDMLPKTALKVDPFDGPAPRSPLTAKNLNASPTAPKPRLEKKKMVIEAPAKPPPQPATAATTWLQAAEPYAARTFDEVKELGDQLGRVLNLNDYISSPLRREQQNRLVWVTKWIDYSSKYGLGYKLSSGAYGVYFNDNTRICLQPDGSTFHYFETTAFEGAPSEVHISGNLTSYPTSLKKKVTLLSYFKDYLDQKVDAYPELPTPSESESDVFIVKKFMLDSRMIVFRFADGSVQANFMDHTKILFNGREKLVGYRTNMEPACTYKLSQIAGREEVRSRLDVLRKVILSNVD
jgi:polo-like kinase 1